MKKYLILICILLLIFLPFTSFAGPPSPKAIVVQEVDGNPRGSIRILKFPNGSLTIDAGTGIVTYSGGGSETDPVVGAITGIVEADGGGNISAATQGVDYYAPGGTDVADGDVADNITLTNISQITTKPITGLSATNWRLFYSADGAVPVELVLGADGTFLESNGASAAPAFRVLASGDIPDMSATYLTLAQIGAAYDTEGELLALFAAKCDESTFGDAVGTGLVLDGTTLKVDTNLQTLTGGSLFDNIDLNEKYLTEDETSLTDSDAPAPNLSGGGTYFEFTDDGGTDVDSITGFTNFPTDTWITFRFEDVYWTVDFSGANLYGHGNLLWTPIAGDSMMCRSHDGTKIECIVSRPSNLAISKYYNIPLDSMPDSDDSWHGPTAEFLAGESLSQWDLVYVTHDTGTIELKKWDADGAAKALKPIGVVIESGGIADTESGTIGIIGGIGRNDGWTFTDNSDEGKTIYGDDATAGALIDAAPSDTGDVVCAVGVLLDEDEILFNFGLCASVEVP